MKTTNFKTMLLAGIILSVFFLEACNKDDASDELSELADTVELVVVSPPNPNVFPVFLMMKDNPELNITLKPVNGGSDVPPEFQSGEADITTIYSYIMANHVVSGKIPDLQLSAVTLWDDFYMVSSPEITSFADLVGKTVLVTGPSGTGENGAPDKILQAAILRTGHQLSDFTIRYELIETAMNEVVSGSADALLLAEPAATGFIIRSLAEQGVTLAKSISLQDVLDGYTLWENGKLPLGGVATLKQYGSQAKTEEVDKFVKAYEIAANRIMMDKQYASGVISEGLMSYYNQEFPSPLIFRALTNGTLEFGSVSSVSDILPELDDFISELIGQSPPADFYKD